jgi:hypothetical protein
MRLLKGLLGILSLFVIASSVIGSEKEQQQQQAFELFENYGEPKNILFSALYGGSSHVNWVLNILQELSSRGHTASYITRVIFSIIRTFTSKINILVLNLITTLIGRPNEIC